MGRRLEKCEGLPAFFEVDFLCNEIVVMHNKTFDILPYPALWKQRVFSKDEIINNLRNNL